MRSSTTRDCHLFVTEKYYDVVNSFNYKDNLFLDRPSIRAWWGPTYQPNKGTVASSLFLCTSQRDAAVLTKPHVR